MDHKREFWRHLRTREIWAVEVREDRVVACWGPLPAAQRLDCGLLLGLPLDTERVEWVERHRPYWLPVFKTSLVA